jgi:hypothetical protein
VTGAEGALSSGGCPVGRKKSCNCAEGCGECSLLRDVEEGGC